MKLSILFFTILFINVPIILNGQTSIKLDIIGTTYYATEGDLNVTAYLEKKLSSRSSLQLGLFYGKFIKERAIQKQTILGPEFDYKRELTGVGITPEFRFYFMGKEDSNLEKGPFISPYGKAYLSWVTENDFIEKNQNTEYGYTLGLGLGVGYKFRYKKFSFTPFLGLGKGISSHKDIFKPGGFDIDFINPDLLIHRLEFLVGYNLIQ